jgi:hypothetical protein
MTEAKDGAAAFEQVLKDELDAIEVSRKEPLADGRSRVEERSEARNAKQGALDRAAGMNLLGLAFSGGGIRSATFNLGVLQALAGCGLLRRVDYLSTVSGGGHIGGWLTAWVKRRGFDHVDHTLKTTDRQSLEPEAAEIRYLREYSNYLTPRKGLFSGDTWAMVSIYLRNVLLNLLILALTIGAALLLLKAVHAWSVIQIDKLDNGAHPWPLMLGIVVSWILASVFAMAGFDFVPWDRLAATKKTTGPSECWESSPPGLSPPPSRWQGSFAGTPCQRRRRSRV